MEDAARHCAPPGTGSSRAHRAGGQSSNQGCGQGCLARSARHRRQESGGAMTARFLFFHRTLRAALVSALLVSALVSALAQTQTTLKKKHAAASAASPTASPAKHPASSGHATTSAHA